MCGFVGIVLDDPRSVVDADLLRRMARTLEHRGPDDEQVLVRGQAGLAFRRLAVIDPAGGRQPIENEDGRVAIVANGEIYNHPELRARLRGAHAWRGASDIEVLLHGYEDEGAAVFESAVGMWAAMIVDDRGPSLRTVLCRDRLGLKPLYLARIPGGWAVASEPKALLVHPALDRRVRGEALLQYLMQGWVSGRDSIWHGVQRLPPGHVAEIEDGTLRVRRFWDAPKDGLRAPASQEEILEWTDRVVRDHLASDVPLGAFLSGGIDSNAVADSMARARGAGAASLRDGLVLCTVAFDERAYDESAVAARSATRLGATHHVRTLAPDPADIDGDAAWLFDEPLSDNSTIPTLLVSRMAREHVTVALSGDGGDEVFGGYRRLVFDAAENRVRRVLGAPLCRAAGALGRVWPKADWLPRPLRARSTLLDLGRDPASAYYASTTQLSRPQALALLKDELVDALGAYDPADEFRAHYERPRGVDALYRAQYADLHTALVERILVKADRASMGASLEARPPLLDHRYLERFMPLPEGEKVRRGRGKHAFREALRSRLPAEILDARKAGFGIPAAQWLRGPLRERVSTAIARLSRDWIDAGRATRLSELHARGLHDATAELWSLVVLDAWRERHGARDLVFGSFA